MNFRFYIVLVINAVILMACQPSQQVGGDVSDKAVRYYLQRQLQQDKEKITQVLNSYFQCRYDYSAKKAKMCSHVLALPSKLNLLSNFLVKENYLSKQLLEQLSVNYFKIYSLVTNLDTEDDLGLPRSIIDQGIEKVCSESGEYEIIVSKDRRQATVNCADQETFNLRCQDNHWKVVLTDY